jgi:hypothetical protein
MFVTIKNQSSLKEYVILKKNNTTLYDTNSQMKSDLVYSVAFGKNVEIINEARTLLKGKGIGKTV